MEGLAQNLAQPSMNQQIDPKMIQEIAQLLMQGVDPQELLQKGVPPEVIMQAIEMLEQQSGGQQPQQAPQGLAESMVM